jgi:hypothetical protein
MFFRPVYWQPYRIALVYGLQTSLPFTYSALYMPISAFCRILSQVNETAFKSSSENFTDSPQPMPISRGVLNMLQRIPCFLSSISSAVVCCLERKAANPNGSPAIAITYPENYRLSSFI